MRKITFNIEESDSTKTIEFITDRTSDWTINQYSRNRNHLTMEEIGDEETNEVTPTSREI
tara:strand:- start:198 stop:377 length:180 start_codon:yes stop_codon:yes gene_type:complete